MEPVGTVDPYADEKVEEIFLCGGFDMASIDAGRVGSHSVPMRLSIVVGPMAGSRCRGSAGLTEKCEPPRQASGRSSTVRVAMDLYVHATIGKDRSFVIFCFI